jgi:hypothetical protein
MRRARSGPLSHHSEPASSHPVGGWVGERAGHGLRAAALRGPLQGHARDRLRQTYAASEIDAWPSIEARKAATAGTRMAGA